jgi:gamma-glutamyltranspeptidase
MEPGFDPAVEEQLRVRGHVIDHSPGWVPAQVNAILKNGSHLEGASDDRMGGKAAGY